MMMLAQESILVERLNDAAACCFEGSKLLHRRDSPYQLIEVYDTPYLGRVLRIDGHCMTSERDEHFYHEPLVHVPAISHPEPRRALLIGGGDGGAAEELLKHPSMEKLVLIEIDSAVIETSTQYLRAVHGDAFDDPRLEVRIADGLEYLAQAGEVFDLIVLDLSDPVGPAEPLYTEAFYRDCRRALAPGGIMSLQVGCPLTDAALSARLVRTLQRVFRIVRPYTVFVPLYGSVLAMVAVSESIDPTMLPVSAVEGRLGRRGIRDLRYYNGDVHCASFALPNYLKKLLRQHAVRSGFAQTGTLRRKKVDALRREASITSADPSAGWRPAARA